VTKGPRRPSFEGLLDCRHERWLSRMGLDSGICVRSRSVRRHAPVAFRSGSAAKRKNQGGGSCVAPAEDDYGRDREIDAEASQEFDARLREKRPE
jgi:hypothetical protein